MLDPVPLFRLSQGTGTRFTESGARKCAYRPEGGTSVLSPLTDTQPHVAKSATRAAMANLALLAIDYDRRLLPDADNVDVFIVNVADLRESAVPRGGRYRAVSRGIKAKHASR